MTKIITASTDFAESRIVEIARYYGIDWIKRSSDNLSDALEKIPVMTKTDLARHAKHDRISRLQKAALFSETSGSTGEPLETPRGLIELDWNTKNLMKAFDRNVQPGRDRVAIIHPSIMSPFVEAACLALKELGIGYLRIFPIPNICSYDRIADILYRYEITTVMTTPTLLRKLLFEVDSGTKHSINSLPIQKALLTGEVVDDFEVHNIERMKPNLKVFPFVYGSSEIATVMIGGKDLFYEPLTNDFLFEIVESKETVKNQETSVGKLLVTWLRPSIFPILRYDTGDLIKFHHGKNASESRIQILGRDRSNSEKDKIKTIIEQTILDFEFPVFHFDAKINNELVKLNIVCRENDVQMLKAKLPLVIEGLPVEMKINDKLHPFMNFSITPKISRYK